MSTPRAHARSGEASVTQSGEVRSARIESLRALAALGVMLGHLYALGRVGQLSPGQLSVIAARGTVGGGGTEAGGFTVEALFGGVFVFFALSGYLLFWPFARQYFGSGSSVDLRRYARNRALRILPLYYAVLIAVLVLQADGGTLEQWWRFGFFLENFSRATAGAVDGPMWSLAVEMMFYIVLPFLVAGLARMSRGSCGRAALLLGVLGLVSLAVRLATVSLATGSVSNIWRMSPVGTFFYFIPGMWLALLRLRWETQHPIWLRGRLASRDTWLVAAAALWIVFASSPRREAVAGPASFLTIGSCVLPLIDGPIVRCLDWRPLAVVGVASYSLYLWHVPLMIAIIDHIGVASGNLGLAAFVIGLTPLCLAAAAISYRMIESPFLRLRKRWAGSATSPLASASPTLDAH